MSDLSDLFDVDASPVGTLEFDMGRLPEQDQQAMRNLYRWAFSDEKVAPPDAPLTGDTP